MIYYDLKQEAKRKSIGNISGRETELKRIARTLKRQFNNNVLIRGASGVGKTALIEGFAYQIASGWISGFEGFRLAKLDGNDLKKYCAQISHQETHNYLTAAFKSIPEKSIIFVDDFEKVIEENKLFELNQIFEPFFERADLSLVLATSETGYERLRSANPSFFQHFEEILLKENDNIETELILNSLLPAFEGQYQISADQNAIKEISELSKKINSDKKLPLRAIHMLDESMAFARISGDKQLTAQTVRQIFSEKTGIPSAILSNAEKDKLKNLENELAKNVVGQKQAIEIVSNVIKRSRMGLRNPQRPYGSFLFLGPSGVGKTELSKTIAKIVYGSERNFTRIDMSEFGEQHTVQRLIGAPPGYIGYEAGGQLTNAVKQRPYSLVLLDEIEKANAKVFDIFLQVLEDGRLTDGQGSTVNFTSSIVVATSNIGISEIVDAYKNGKDINHPSFLEQTLMPLLTKNFRIEFLNRFDALIIFNPLSHADLMQIATLEIKKIEYRTSEHKIKFHIDQGILSRKISELLDYKLGARPVKRFVEQTCETLIAAKLMD